MNHRELDSPCDLTEVRFDVIKFRRLPMKAVWCVTWLRQGDRAAGKVSGCGRPREGRQPGPVTGRAGENAETHWLPVEKRVRKPLQRLPLHFFLSPSGGDYL